LKEFGINQKTQETDNVLNFKTYFKHNYIENMPTVEYNLSKQLEDKSKEI